MSTETNRDWIVPPEGEPDAATMPIAMEEPFSDPAAPYQSPQEPAPESAPQQPVLKPAGLVHQDVLRPTPILTFFDTKTGQEMRALRDAAGNFYKEPVERIVPPTPPSVTKVSLEVDHDTGRSKVTVDGVNPLWTHYHLAQAMSAIGGHAAAVPDFGYQDGEDYADDQDSAPAQDYYDAEEVDEEPSVVPGMKSAPLGARTINMAKPRAQRRGAGNEQAAAYDDEAVAGPSLGERARKTAFAALPRAKKLKIVGAIILLSYVGDVVGTNAAGMVSSLGPAVWTWPHKVKEYNYHLVADPLAGLGI